MKKPIHYDDRSEIRDKGVGFYRLSQVEEERQQQLNALNRLRVEVSYQVWPSSMLVLILLE